MATIHGTFPDANGVVTAHDGLAVDARKDGTRYHLDVEGVGRGTVTMTGMTGTGRFRLLDDTLVDVVATQARDGLRYRLHRLGDDLANGLIRDLPP